ncbi:hypothetical protein HYT05_04395 [Candidatus Kaiserbacteria bacterium]|nr:hypothetical protein [Candidatus Kaiserbacteria bacterium]
MSARRVSTIAATALITVAILIDGLQFLITLFALLPAIGPVLSFTLGFVVSVLSIFLYGIWFSHLNVSLTTRYPLGFLATIVLEFIPVVSTSPGWTWFVVKTIAQERIRERLSSDEV